VDFYAEQDNARRKTRVLVLLFVVAVVLLIGITNILIAAMIYLLGASSLPFAGGDTIDGAMQWFTAERFAWVCMGVMGSIFVVVLFKWAQLSAGGKGVAERLGGERILPQTDDPQQRRCLNVVEEMALAAGLPVPPVYVLAKERGINAFAAGISPADAVIGITQGSLNSFNREQMQGVIAHEFSHILNGDMRLNIRLAALLKGITFVGDVGEMVVRGGSRRHGSRSSSRRSPQLLAIGMALWVVGWLGGLFAGFIKAAVSRQRELLADASAVQFTRNPGGVADALKVIGGHVPGTTIVEVRASELSHIFFGQVGSGLVQVFATHPPLPERIRKVEPGWDGEYIYQERSSHYEGTVLDKQRRAQERKEAATTSAAIIAAAVLGPGAEAAVRDAGFTASSDAGLSAGSPPAPGVSPQLAEQAHDPLGANAIVYGLLLSRDPVEQDAQIELIGGAGVRGLAITVADMAAELAALPVEWRLPLLEMSLPALKCMSPQQYRSFKETLLKVVRADSKIDLYEWCIYQVVRHYLDPEFLQVKASAPRYRKPVHVRQEYRTVVSVLAWRGHVDEVERERAFHRGVESVGLYNLTLRPLEECSVTEFSKSVHKLADCYPLLKPRLLKGMAACAAHDGELTVQEREILVAVAAVMDCPLPADVRRPPQTSLPGH
jgi:Zn-dependent protease with chaperone function